MFISTRYLLKQLFLASVCISFILSAAIWLTQSLRFIDVVINKGLPFTTFFKLTFCLFPDIFGVILPIGFFIAIIFTYNKLEHDHELIVFRTTGISDLKLASPVLMLAMVIMIFLYYVNMHLMPQTLREFKDMEHTIRNQASAILIKEGQFTNLQGATIFVKSQNPGGLLEGILVHNARKPTQSNTIIAEKGYLSQTPQGLQLVMENGSRQQLKRGSRKPELLYFDEYTVNLTQQSKKVNKRDRKPYEMGLVELLNPLKPDLQNLGQMRAEAHKRIIMPFLSLVFALVAISVMLFGEFSRRRRLKRILTAVGCVLGIQLFTLAMLNLSDKLPWVIPILYGVIILIATAFFALLNWHWKLPQALRVKS